MHPFGTYEKTEIRGHLTENGIKLKVYGGQVLGLVLCGVGLGFALIGCIVSGKEFFVNSYLNSKTSS